MRITSSRVLLVAAILGIAAAAPPPLQAEPTEPQATQTDSQVVTPVSPIAKYDVVLQAHDSHVVSLGQDLEVLPTTVAQVLRTQVAPPLDTVMSVLGSQRATDPPNRDQDQSANSPERAARMTHRPSLPDAQAQLWRRQRMPARL